MAAEVISNVGNKYLFAKESQFGTVPVSPTALDCGWVQSITINEDDQVEEVRGISSGATVGSFEDGLYKVTGSIQTKVTKASLKVLLEALFGVIAADTPQAGKYTVTASAITSATLSYCMKVNTINGKTKHISGIHVTGGELTVNKGGDVECTLNFVAQLVAIATETITPFTNTGSLFKDLDATITYNGAATIMQAFSISVDWNINDDDSRGIEAAHANGRRVISRVVRNNLSLTGSFETESDDAIDTGYVAERSDVPIVLTLSRAASNSHAFTIAASRVKTRNRDFNNDAKTKTIKCDFVGKTCAIVGDA